MAGRFTITIQSAWCKSCGICVEFCPKKVFDMNIPGGAVATRADDCIGCRMCEQRCPDYAITVDGGEENAK